MRRFTRTVTKHQNNVSDNFKINSRSYPESKSRYSPVRSTDKIMQPYTRVASGSRRSSRGRVHSHMRYSGRDYVDPIGSETPPVLHGSCRSRKRRSRKVDEDNPRWVVQEIQRENCNIENGIESHKPDVRGLSPGERLMQALCIQNVGQATGEVSGQKRKHGDAQEIANLNTEVTLDCCKKLENHDENMKIEVKVIGGKDVEMRHRDSSCETSKDDLFRSKTLHNSKCHNGYCAREEVIDSTNSYETAHHNDLRGNHTSEDESTTNNLCEESASPKIKKKLKLNIQFSSDEDELLTANLSVLSLEEDSEMNPKDSFNMQVIQKCLYEYRDDIRRQWKTIQKLFDEVEDSLTSSSKQFQQLCIHEKSNLPPVEIFSTDVGDRFQDVETCSEEITTYSQESFGRMVQLDQNEKYDSDVEMELTARSTVEYVLCSSSDDDTC